jgi:2-polyprenyl-6-methoxyphenol hydroxylase-like FAD-dependent oxidoreductase
MRIAIIGSGIAGSLLAKNLDGVPGLTVDLYERAALGEHDGAGTGLNLGPNGFKALRLHDPETHARLRAASFEWRTWVVELVDGTKLLDLDLLDLADETGARLRWSELYALMRAPVLARTRYGHAFETLEEDSARRLVPVFKTPSGQIVRDGGYDLVVAGDGRFSKLRELTCGPIQSQQMGIGIWRLLTSDEGSPFDDYRQWFHGNNRLLAYRVPGGHVYACGVFALGGAAIEAHHKTEEFRQACFRPEGKPPCPSVAWILARAREEEQELHWARLQVSPLLRGDATGRVLLLGDAAQAMVPTLGQGATQAIEDGVIAASILRKGGGVKEIAASRDARVEFVRDFSLEATDTMLGADPVAGTLAKSGPEFLAKLKKLYRDVPGP